jgi:predicted HicB family RNase H-like nuclease
MKDIIRYNNFIGSVHFSTDDEIFYGKIEGINDLVTFEGSTVRELKKAFEDAVDDYLSICEEVKKDPFKSFKGSFNVRINPELHKKAFQLATIEGVSLNALIQDAIENEINNKQDRFSLVK